MNLSRNILFLALFILLTVNAGASQVQWTFDQPLGNVDSSPSVADINSDGRDEVIATTVTGVVIALDSQGGLLWHTNLKIPISISPTVVDLVEDPAPEVLVLNQTGTLYCLSSVNGSIIWSYDLPGDIEWGTTAIVVADLNGDNELEIITGTRQGHVVCLSAQGVLKWTFKGNHGFTLSPTVGMLGDATEPSIVVSGTTVPLLCLDATGKEVWRIDGPAKGAAPIIADINQDGANEILTGYDTALMAVDGHGTVLWKLDLPKEIDSSICVADADENGLLEIYAIDLSGLLFAVAPDGSEQWRGNVEQRVRRSPAIADVDGDDAIEIVVAGYSGKLHVFNAKGELKEALPMNGTTNSSPTLADLSGDGTPYIIYPANSGQIIAFKWPNAKPDAKRVWSEYRFDAARTGAYRSASDQSKVRIRRADFGALYAGPNTFTIEIENPDHVALRIETRVEQSDRDDSAATSESSEESITISTDYTLPINRPTEIRLACCVYEGETLVARRTETAYVIPFAKELAEFQDRLDAAESLAGQLPQPQAFLGRFAQMATILAGYKERVTVVGTKPDVEARELCDVLRAGLQELEETIALLRCAVQSNANGAWPLRLVKANPWAPFGGFDEIREGRLQEGQLEIEAFNNETEDTALNIFNLDMTHLEARVEIDPIVLRDSADTKPCLPRDAITLHEVVAVPTQMLDMSADVLPVMNSGYVMQLPGWHARQLWLKVDTHALSPGTWDTTLRIRTLEMESKQFTMPLTITVWPAALPEKRALNHCNWGYVYRTDRMKDLEDESLADRIAHGNNVFVTTLVPQAEYNDAGEIVGAIDFTQHDAFVQKYAPHGMILFHSLGGLRGPGDITSDAAKKAYVAWLRAWVAHLQEMGIDYSQYAMYPVDEPGLNEGLVDLYLNFAKLAREADPKILMYTDPVDRIREEELVEMLPYVDIWCPNRTGFFLGKNEDKLQIIYDSGKPVWTYACADNAKHQSPLGYYRCQSWAAWAFNLKGIGFWSYCTSGADPWYKPDGTLDYLLVYPGDGVVISKRWEAVRDGMEDYDMLLALRSATEKAAAANRAPEAIKEAQTLLGEKANTVADYIGRDKDGTTPGSGGAAATRKLEDKRFANIQTIRREIARLIEALE
ncbi:MAG TPA: PQQ-binding-like beta-propeller repeat protein [Candidatus Bathyarchaeia archaeon]|nr:PQQ-binding-like beta-propeller repeat protein [Candidatus Bathyarchaeia archaeon]